MSVQGGSSAARVRTVQVGADAAGQRVDNFVMRALRGVPRTRIYRLLRRGEVRVNGGRSKPARRLEHGDRVRLPPVRREQYSEGRLPASVLERLRDAVVFEDAEAIVVDKPAGVAVHAGTGLGGGLIDGLRSLRPEIERLELVHRLDRDTSGCILLAKGRPALKRLQQAMQAGAFDKIYRALLLGDWVGPEETVTASLRRDRLASGERIVRVDPQGQAARSEFLRLRGGPGLTEVEVALATGRTHQIRVHAAHLGHPVAGDAKYGRLERERALLGARSRRLYLHARRLRFPGTDGMVTVEASVPPEFGQAMGASA